MYLPYLYLDLDLSRRHRDRLRRCRRHHNQFMQRHKRQRPTDADGLRTTQRRQGATTGNATGAFGEQEGGEGRGMGRHAMPTVDLPLNRIRCPFKALILVLPRTTQVPPELEARMSHKSYLSIFCVFLHYFYLNSLSLSAQTLPLPQAVRGDTMAAPLPSRSLPPPRRLPCSWHRHQHPFGERDAYIF